MKTFNKLFFGCFIIAASVAGFFSFEKNAAATGPASCPAGKTALAQLYGTSQYCALSSCRTEYQHADRSACIKGHCYVVEKYEARPVLPSPPSPAGAWQNQAACPVWTNTATWY